MKLRRVPPQGGLHHQTPTLIRSAGHVTHRESKPKVQAAASLSDFISSNIEPILAAWEAFAQGLIAARQLDPAEARDHAKGIVLAIVADMDRPQTPLEQAEKSMGRAPLETAESQAHLHGARRLLEGFSVAEGVSEFRALRASVLKLWAESSATALQSDVDGLIRFNEAVDKVLAESVARYGVDQRHTARMLEALLSSSPDLHYVVSPDGKFVYANNAVGAVFGAGSNQLIGKSCLDFCAASDPDFRQQFARAVRSKSTCRGDMPCTLPSGESATYEYILVPILDSEDNVEAVAGTARDMSERNRFESDLRREKAISDTIIECAPGAFFMIDEKTNLVRWNKYLSKETGLSDEELLGKSILSTIYEQDRPLAAAKFLTAFATGNAHMEVRVPTPAQGLRFYLKTARRLMVDEVPHVAGYCIDITDRKHAEEALTHEKAFYDALIESAPGAFYVVDMEGNYIRWNSYLKRLTGLSDQELLNRSSLLGIVEEDRPLAAETMKTAVEQGYAQAELHMYTHDLGVRQFFVIKRRFQVSGIRYLVGVGIDTTEWLAKMKGLEHDAWTDPLTQLPNRGHFMEIARQEFSRCRRYGHPLSLWMLDVDHFKTVNDTYGHPAGDAALQAVASTSQKALRDWDILGRIGGEEFAVLLPETETAQSLLVAERLRQMVATAKTPLGDGESTRITVSVGIASVCDEDADVDALLKRADHALWEAKRTGCDKVCLAEVPGGGAG